MGAEVLRPLGCLYRPLINIVSKCNQKVHKRPEHHKNWVIWLKRVSACLYEVILFNGGCEVRDKLIDCNFSFISTYIIEKYKSKFRPSKKKVWWETPHRGNDSKPDLWKYRFHIHGRSFLVWRQIFFEVENSIKPLSVEHLYHLSSEESHAYGRSHVEQGGVDGWPWKMTIR